MTIKNGDVLVLMKGLSELEELKLPLNIKTSYILARDRQNLTPIVNIIQQKQVEIYKKYGEQTGKGEYKVSEDKLDIVQEELDELLEIENEVELMKVKLDGFGENNVPFYIVEKLLLIIDE